MNNMNDHKLIKTLADIGIALSAEKDHTRLLEKILIKAQDLTHADGGTLYSCQDDKELKFEIMINKSMGMHFGGTSKEKATFRNLPLYNEHAKPNEHMLATYVALNKKTVNIKDAYSDTHFDLSGPKDFDKATGYHSQSFLVVPLTNHLNEVIGVMQLINSLDNKTQKVKEFSDLDQLLAESLASQAAITITNMQLIQAQKELFDGFIQLVAKAIDDKSPYTGAHCHRVPIITKMIAQAACTIDKGPLKDFSMTEDQQYELEVAAWLHDCGKIITPEAVVDKSTKLELIIDGINLINTRFEVLKRDAIISALQQQVQARSGKPYQLNQDSALQNVLTQLEQERDLLNKFNIGGEQMLEEDVKTIDKIAKRKWVTPSGAEESVLTDKEVQLLNIKRGTLSDEERQIINHHVTMTLQMLNSLPYPKKLRNVPEYAGSHHEKMNGTGYPRGLVKDQMSIPARMIAIADIFEALTAADRPYKQGMHLTQALSILGKMKLEGHIDPDLFDVFIHEKIYERYAKQFLSKDALDIVDITKIPGYKALD